MSGDGPLTHHREIFKDDRDREKLLGIIREKKKEEVLTCMDIA